MCRGHPGHRGADPAESADDLDPAAGSGHHDRCRAGSSSGCPAATLGCSASSPGGRIRTTSARCAGTTSADNTRAESNRAESNRGGTASRSGRAAATAPAAFRRLSPRDFSSAGAPPRLSENLRGTRATRSGEDQWVT